MMTSIQGRYPENHFLGGGGADQRTTWAGIFRSEPGPVRSKDKNFSPGPARHEVRIKFLFGSGRIKSS